MVLIARNINSERRGAKEGEGERGKEGVAGGEGKCV